MKIITNTFNLVMCFFLTLLLGCAEKETQVEVSSVSLNTATIEMVEGETFSLVATVLPKDAEYDGVIWASSNASVASVNSGTVAAIKEGTATITASAGGKSATCSVKVSTKVVAVTSITLDKRNLSIKVGESETIIATVWPDNATDKSVTWLSSDVSVATVSDGVVIGKGFGTATITAKSGICTADCNVAVTVDVESLSIDKTDLSLAIGETAQLTANVKPDIVSGSVKWTSSDESIAKVNGYGLVTAINYGDTKITAAVGNKSSSCIVEVRIPDNVIFYTTTDKKVLKPYNEDAFGSAIVSNTYNGDIGIITFEKPVTFIGNMAFYEQSKLQSIIIPNSVSTIGKKAFYTCNGLLSVKLPQGLISIDDEAFYMCFSMKALTFPDTVLEIGESAFSLTNAFDSGTVILPKNLHTIKSYAFGDCHLREIIWPEGLKTIESDAFMRNDFKEITVPGNVTTLGSGLFVSCISLTNAVFQEGITKVPDNCFDSCVSLTNVTLPSTVKIIDYSAFEKCLMLKNLYVMAMAPPIIGKDIFKDVDLRVLSIMVPRESVDAYKEKWSAYKDNIKGYDF